MWDKFFPIGLSDGEYVFREIAISSLLHEKPCKSQSSHNCMGLDNWKTPCNNASQRHKEGSNNQHGGPSRSKVHLLTSNDYTETP